ncbi:hypothetical protein ZEAMMB73_Zm00001d033713 [Zea mays]|uniref:THH1/TOM1/TOM3 domain-containing protein n=1 Tax=Zea mays TaxID=4577 RepID=A0A1R3MIT0_MAIZE|nr:hypothetical protein ZEAMMB73_Zm00001d033713 [Zea mays]
MLPVLEVLCCAAAGRGGRGLVQPVLRRTLQTNPRLEGALEMLLVLEVLCCAAAGRGGVDWYSLCCCGRFRRTPDWRAPWRCSWCSRSSGGCPGDAPGARGAGGIHMTAYFTAPWAGGATSTSRRALRHRLGRRAGKHPPASLRFPDPCLVQLIRIECRVSEYGWTTQKVFQFLNFLVNGVRSVVFVLRRNVQLVEPEDMPGLAFFTTYALLVLFWAKIYYQARAMSTDWLRPTFYWINGVVYAIQEFVAHTLNVNCAKFGRRASRILITGGEDLKVNLWAIGKPGFTSPVESVSFDSSEVTIGAGAASGTIKIWNIEEAKVVRTFTGHKSSCASLDFHRFGEFLAIGSSDTNMKIWDTRQQRCIHTYKGHTQRINVLKFTPDGRWIVSGGADNSVKVWDLTAGKLMHDFCLHEGPVNCLVVHPYEFLLATGSVDKTVKFWDLETFELIGSAGHEILWRGYIKMVYYQGQAKMVIQLIRSAPSEQNNSRVICYTNGYMYQWD